MIGSYKTLDLLKNADYGFIQSGPTSMATYDFNNVLDNLNTLINNNNQAHNVKTNNTKIEEDFIAYAHLKSNT